MEDIRGNILNEVNNERNYQVQRWGNDADDTVNEPNDFVSYITHYASRWFPGAFVPYETAAVDKFRESMIKVAAIAVAAVESIDRQRKENNTAFYEGNTDA